MAFIRCIGKDSEPKNVSYQIRTISSGGSDAIIEIKKHIDNKLVDAKVFLYTSSASTQTFYDLLLDYGTTATQKWSVFSGYNKIGYNGTEYSYGELISQWTYSTSVDMALSKIEPNEKPESSLSVSSNLTESLLEFWNDSRFEITYNQYGAWSVQNLFTYDGHNMYSSPQIQHNQTSEVYIKNISDDVILVKAVYDSSTERKDFDYGTIYMDNVVIQTNIGGSESGITGVFGIPNGAVMKFTYKKDGSGSTGLDNIGILIYEIGE